VTLTDLRAVHELTPNMNEPISPTASRTAPDGDDADKDGDTDSAIIDPGCKGHFLR
jgi:hypothetical protein